MANTVASDGEVVIRDTPRLLPPPDIDPELDNVFCSCCQGNMLGVIKKVEKKGQWGIPPRGPQQRKSPGHRKG